MQANFVKRKSADPGPLTEKVTVSPDSRFRVIAGYCWYHCRYHCGSLLVSLRVIAGIITGIIAGHCRYHSGSLRVS